MDNRQIENLRQTYESPTLSLSDIHMDPLRQFSSWFEDALDAELSEPNAFSLATVSKDGQPSNRIVLFKGLKEGFIFYTNYKSQKGRNLAENPKASACFFWQGLHRQVRIEGICKKLNAEQSDDYFNKRPLGSRIGAITSPQSEEIDSREWLQMMWEANAAELGNHPSRPEYWGGYELIPHRIEFWQGQPSRLHDRFVYEKTEKGAWSIKRVAP
ncbi:MAG: pyridoxamine 5'-phosphate oxidase [Saprospiraceae bacterium]|nr:pyridoxamine 5'-phosphate oxidase [Saprospiraceae bacterium]